MAPLLFVVQTLSKLYYKHNLGLNGILKFK